MKLDSRTLARKLGELRRVSADELGHLALERFHVAPHAGDTALELDRVSSHAREPARASRRDSTSSGTRFGPKPSASVTSAISRPELA